VLFIYFIFFYVYFFFGFIFFIDKDQGDIFFSLSIFKICFYLFIYFFFFFIFYFFKYDIFPVVVLS
jgi:hypothetical protein